jgi:hypothetical protein
VLQSDADPRRGVRRLAIGTHALLRKVPRNIKSFCYGTLDRTGTRSIYLGDFYGGPLGPPFGFGDDSAA